MDKLVIEFGAKLEDLLLTQAASKNGFHSFLKGLARKHHLKFGVKLPTLAFTKNALLNEYEYQLILLGEQAGKGQIIPNAMMAIPPKHNKIKLSGIELTAPVLGTPVTWIPKNKTRKAEAKGFSLVSPLDVLMQHISTALLPKLDVLFTKEALNSYIDALPNKCQSHLSEIVPSLLSFGDLLSVFQMLLAEKVSIKDSGLILKAIYEAAQTTKDIEVITEHIRGSLARQITASHLSGKGYLPLIPLSEDWENEFKKHNIHELNDIDVPVQHAFHDSLGEVLVRANAAGEKNPVILTRASSRRAVKTLMHQFDEDIPVLSQNEIHADIELKTIAWIS